MDKKTIPEGYKQTEVGIIPEEWDIKSFVEVTSLITCGIAATPDYVSESEGYPFLSSTNIKNGRIIWKNYKHISKGLHKQLYRNNPPLVGDVLYSRVGTIGEAAVIEDSFEFSVYVSLTLIKPKRQILLSYYLMQLLNSIPYKSRALEQVYLGGGVGNLNVDVVRNYPIIIPPFKEQTAIANALSDVDVLIAELEKLIAKKQAIKTATMQQLLTGRTRFPEFATHPDGTPKCYKQTELGEIPEDWEVVPFGNTLTIRHGKNQKAVENPNGTIPIFATGGQIGWADQHLWNKPSVLIGRKGTIDRPRYSDQPFWTVDTLFYSEIKGCANPRFIFYKFCMIDWMQYNEASGVPSLNASTIERVLVSLPQKDEQTTIANILSDMDEEVQSLQQRLGKTRQLKQGMMQELLTGKTRLVKPEAVA